MANPLTAGIPKEADPGEQRVAIVPASVPALKKMGLNVLVQSNAGLAAGFRDSEYIEKGAVIAPDRSAVFTGSDILLQVRSLGACGEAGVGDAAQLTSRHTLIAGCEPLWCPDPTAKAAASGAAIFALELVPRITRAQSMDILSSMATISGYRAVLIAASLAPRMFPMMMTAAGTLKPARVLVIGAGVAGLQAIASARRLGAVVFGYDIRPVVKEQVESLGAKFVELDVKAESAEGQGGYAKQMSDEFYRLQQEAMTKVIAGVDIVITTAAIPGRKSPVLVTRPMVEAMTPGSVIVDIAAERGGNCELTSPGATIVHQGVTIAGPLNLPSTVPVHASEMFSRNTTTFLQLLVRNGELKVDTTDEIIRETLVARGGSLVHPKVREAAGLGN